MDISATWICDIRNFVVVPLEEYVLIKHMCISLDEIIIIWREVCTEHELQKVHYYFLIKLKKFKKFKVACQSSSRLAIKGLKN